MALASSPTPRELAASACGRPACAVPDLAIACMQDIINHEHALVESIPDDEKAALMPIIRFIRNTLQDFSALLSDRSAAAAPHLAQTCTQIRNSSCPCSGYKLHTQLNCRCIQDAVRKHAAPMALVYKPNSGRSSDWRFASAPSLTMSSVRSSDGLPTQVRGNDSILQKEAHNSEVCLHRVHSPQQLDASFPVSPDIRKPKYLPSFREKPDRDINKTYCSLDMDSFNLDEIRRSLQPPTHCVASDGNDVQNSRENDHDDSVNRGDDSMGCEEVNDDDSHSYNPSQKEIEEDVSESEWTTKWDPGTAYHQTVLSGDFLQFPKVHCRRRHIVKKAIGWITKRTAMSLVSRVRHKPKCHLPCCADCEMGTKRRKASKFGSRKCARLSTMTKLASSLTGTTSVNTTKTSSRESTKARSICDLTASSDSCDEKETSHVTQNLDNSSLTTALTAVFTNSRGQGLTSCEVLRALIGGGFLKGIEGYEDHGYEDQALASHVKTILQECSHFRKLKNHRFVLNSISMQESANLHGQTPLEGDSESYGKISQKELSLSRMLSREKEEGLLLPATNHNPDKNPCQNGAGGVLQYQKRNAIVSGSFCNEYYQLSRTSSVPTAGCFPAERVDSCEASNHRRSQVKEEDMSAVVADGCSGKSAEARDPTKRIRCCRTDGKNWRCSLGAQKGSSYCERHQSRCKKGMAKQSLSAPPICKESKKLHSEETPRHQNQCTSQVRTLSMQLRPRSYISTFKAL